MKEYSANAYKQAYVISNFLVDIGELIISEDLLNVMEKRMNKDYYFSLNDIKKGDILPDTEKILTVVYLDGMIEEKEKERINKLTKELRKIIVKDEAIEAIQALIPSDLSGMNIFERIRIKLNRLFTKQSYVLGKERV